jgi:hypothetical protein
MLRAAARPNYEARSQHVSHADEPLTNVRHAEDHDVPQRCHTRARLFAEWADQSILVIGTHGAAYRMEV